VAQPRAHRRPDGEGRGARPPGPPGPPPPAPPPPSARQPWPHQLRTLARRQTAVIAADWRNFLFLALGVLLPGVAMLALVKSGSLAAAATPRTDGRVLLLALVVAAVCIAAANSLREI